MQCRLIISTLNTLNKWPDSAEVFKVGVCTLAGGTGRRWSSMTAGILALREHLIEAQVTCMVVEATGDYWKPFYYLLENAPFEVMLVNAHDAKNLPGRKTVVSDAAWLARPGAPDGRKLSQKWLSWPPASLRCVDNDRPVQASLRELVAAAALD